MSSCSLSCLLAFPVFHQPLEAWNSSPEPYVLVPGPSTKATPTSPVQRLSSRPAPGFVQLALPLILWLLSGLSLWVWRHQVKTEVAEKLQSNVLLAPTLLPCCQIHYPKDTRQGISLLKLGQHETVKTAVDLRGLDKAS